MNEESFSVPVRAINDAGIERFSRFLADIRKGEKRGKELFDLVSDPEYSSEISGEFGLNPDCEFKTQKDMIAEFRNRLGDEFIKAHRKDQGFWTWAALFYHPQILKSARKPGADSCWIYDPENYREFRRHYLAGTIYLHEDFANCCPEAQEILFSGKLTAFGGMRDAITYNQEVARIPAVMEVVAWLYYDPSTQKKFKAGSTPQDKPGTIRDLIHVVGHFAKTRDFHGVEDAPELWRLLPEQFTKFKGSAVH